MCTAGNGNPWMELMWKYYLVTHLHFQKSICMWFRKTNLAAWDRASHVFFSFKSYIVDYAVTDAISFPPMSPSILNPSLLRQFPYLCWCPWVMCISSLAIPFPALYFMSPWLFCGYQFVLLNPLTSSQIPPKTPSYMATIKTLSISMILSVLVA